MSLKTPPGLVGHIAKYHDQSSYKVAPMFGIAAGLSAVSRIAGSHYALDMPSGPVPTNLFIVALGESGSGKEYPRTVIKEALHLAGEEDCVTAAASSPALLRGLAKAKMRLLMPDEFGMMVKAVAHDQSGHQTQMLTLCMKMHGLSAGGWTEEYLYSNPKDNIKPIEKPNLGIFATTTPDELSGGMTTDHILNGFANRFMWIWEEDAGGFREGPKAKLNGKCEAGILELSHGKKLFRIQEGSAKAHADGITPIKIKAPLVKQLIKYRDECEVMVQESTKFTPLWARAYENMLRVLAVVSLGCSDPDKPVVDQKSVDWAIEFSRYSMDTAMRLTRDITDSEHEDHQNYIVNAIAKLVMKPPKGDNLATSGWITKHALIQRTRKLTPVQRDAVILTLTEGHMCIKRDVKIGVRTTTLFTLPDIYTQMQVECRDLGLDNS